MFSLASAPIDVLPTHIHLEPCLIVGYFQRLRQLFSTTRCSPLTLQMLISSCRVQSPSCQGTGPWHPAHPPPSCLYTAQGRDPLLQHALMSGAHALDRNRRHDRKEWRGKLFVLTRSRGHPAHSELHRLFFANERVNKLIGSLIITQRRQKDLL